MHIASEYNKRNMSGVKMAYQLKVRRDLCLWNAEYKIVVESCLLELRTAFSLRESNLLRRSAAELHTDTQHTHTHTHWHTHTHTHTQTNKYPCSHSHNTNTTYQQSLITTQYKSITQYHNCMTVFSVDWLQEQQEVLKVKYWIESWETSKHTK
jgi:hypothetical protein